MEWDAKKYNKNHDFIFKYGENLLELLPKEPKKIIDIGCGTGALTHQMAELGHEIIGIDQSVTMIQQAKKTYPDIPFFEENILNPSSKLKTYDIAFSNAVFHWITDQDRLLNNIYQLLNPHGELICEFGAIGNVQLIREAFKQELQKLDKIVKEPFTFTSIEAYRKLLEKNQFEVVEILEYERPTPLKDGTAGLKHWMEQFYPNELSELTQEQREQVIGNMEEQLQPVLWKNTHWEADYRRLKMNVRKSK